MILFGLLMFILSCVEEKLVRGQYYHDCRDRLDTYTCYNWYSAGMCYDYHHRVLMYDNCQKTCNLCTTWNNNFQQPLVCEDNRKACSKWKKHCQQDSQYYDFMKKNCQRTCLFCEDENCVDRKERCEKYQGLGYCEENNIYHRFMAKNCEKSCKFCLGPQDKERKVMEQLESYKKEYFCDFEIDECAWSNRIFEDTADWLVGFHEYGPISGFNSSKSYLYLDAKYESYYAYVRLPWELVLPKKERDKGKMCFHFMYQINRGCKLIVSQLANPTSSNKYPAEVVKYTGESTVTSWTHVKLDVYVSDTFELVIKGVKGDPESYLAIDYVFFTKGMC